MVCLTMMMMRLTEKNFKEYLTKKRSTASYQGWLLRVEFLSNILTLVPVVKMEGVEESKVKSKRSCSCKFEMTFPLVLIHNTLWPQQLLRVQTEVYFHSLAMDSTPGYESQNAFSLERQEGRHCSQAWREEVWTFSLWWSTRTLIPVFCCKITVGACFCSLQ